MNRDGEHNNDKHDDGVVTVVDAETLQARAGDACVGTGDETRLPILRRARKIGVGV